MRKKGYHLRPQLYYKCTQTDRQTDGQTDRRTDARTYIRTDGQTDKRRKARADAHRCTDDRTKDIIYDRNYAIYVHRQTNERTVACTHIRTDGQTHRRRKAWTDARRCTDDRTKDFIYDCNYAINVHRRTNERTDARTHRWTDK